MHCCILDAPEGEVHNQLRVPITLRHYSQCESQRLGRSLTHSKGSAIQKPLSQKLVNSPWTKSTWERVDVPTGVGQRL